MKEPINIIANILIKTRAQGRLFWGGYTRFMSRLVGFMGLEISLSGRIYLVAFGIIVAVGGSLTFVLINQNRLNLVANEILDTKLSAIQYSQKTKESLLAHSNASFQYVITQNPGLLKEASEKRLAAEANAERLRPFLGNPVSREIYVSLRKEMKKYFSEVKLLRDQSDKSRLPEEAGLFRAARWARQAETEQKKIAILSLEKESRLRNIFSLSDSLINHKRAELAAARVEMNEMTSRSSRMAFLVVLLASTFVLFLAVGVAVSIVRALRELMMGVLRIERGEINFEIPSSSSAEFNRLTQAFNRMARTIEEQRQKLLNETITDELTEAFNQRHFRRLLAQEFIRAQKSGEPLCLLMVDADNFKVYNDSQGHELGNEVLRLLSRTIQDNLRKEDFLSRYGGDEFAILLPNTDPEQAKAIGARLGHAIETARFPGQNVLPEGHFTISMGGACYPMEARSSLDLINKADAGLMAAKRQGRNCLRWYSPRLKSASRRSGPRAA